jgi:hypothetical protein
VGAQEHGGAGAEPLAQQLEVEAVERVVESRHVGA